MQVRTEEGKIKDVSILNVTRENYIVPQGEEHLYHCRIEVKKFNPDNGERLSTPRIQCFGKKFFESGGLEELMRQGYSVDILSDPNRWTEEEKRKAEEEEKRKAEEAKAKEKEAMKAEIIAELKAEGVIPEEKKEKQTKK